MGKTKIVLDTSAIISLGCTRKFNLIGRIFDLNSPMRVKEELEDISKTNDEIGKIAKVVLDSNVITFRILSAKLQNIQGEIEVVNLANELKTEAIVMDDLQYIKKLEKKTNIPIWFSSFILYSLFEQKLITHKDGYAAIENMKTKRKWEENLMIESAKILFEKAAKENKK